MNKFVEIFKALSDSVRLRIMYLLINTGEEMCSCEICDSLVEPQYSISRNMKILKQCGIVTEQKEGKWVYYSVSQKSQNFFESLYKVLKIIPDPKKILVNDLRRFKKRMKLRKNGRCLIGIQNKELMG